MSFWKRKSLVRPSSKTKNDAVLTQTSRPRSSGPSVVDHNTRQLRSSSRLKRMSDATVRRLSLPLSKMSTKSSISDRRVPRTAATPTRNSISSRASRSDRTAPSSRPTSGSRRSSDAAAPDTSGGSLGELPEVEVSQRAYFASLASLFSDGNARDNASNELVTPMSSAMTAMTSPSIGPAGLGLYEYELGSAAVYPFSKARGLYVGLPGLVTPPAEALFQFEMETLPLLERDLQGVSGHLGQQGIRITYELRMSGYASPAAETVTLLPRVWILYRSYTAVGTRVSVAELHRAVSEIFYLQRGLEIQEGGGRYELSSDQRLVDTKPDDRDSIKLSDGGALSIHVEDCHGKQSVCGALCCVTIEEGAAQTQSLCRVGGLVKINGKYILGVSTGHTMLDSSAVFRDSFDDAHESKLPQGKAVDRDVIMKGVARVSNWHNVTRDAAVDFLGVSMNSRGEMAINRSRPENATDFALLRMRKMPGDARNQYVPPGAEEAVSITSTASASSSSMDEGPVYILCGGGDVVPGQLVWGSACFTARGRQFRVRRVQLRSPLDAGTAGAWVVRGEVLYGVLVAVYENEPYALMMTAERLFSSIMRSAFSIRSVELWDGELPNIHRPKEPVVVESQQRSKEKGAEGHKNEIKTAAPTKQNVEVRTTLRSRTRSEGSHTDLQPVPESQDAHHQHASRATRADHVSPRPPSNAEPGTRTDDLHDATRETESVSRHHTTDSYNNNQPKTQRRPRVESRTLSNASEITMSGAVPVSDEPEDDKVARSDNTADFATTTEDYVKPTSRVRSPSRDFDSKTAAASTTTKTMDPTPGGRDSQGDNAAQSDSRRSSLQLVLDKTFRRGSRAPSSRAPSRDNNFGIPHGGLDARPPVFSRRGSSAVDPTPRYGGAVESSAIAGGSDADSSSFSRRWSSTTGPPRSSDQFENHGTPQGGLDERSSIFRRGWPGKSKPKHFDRSNNFGIPQGGL